VLLWCLADDRGILLLPFLDTCVFGFAVDLKAPFKFLKRSGYFMYHQIQHSKIKRSSHTVYAAETWNLKGHNAKG
jgi:hypothetical protein